MYDATKFLQDHPGGPESILIVAGQVRAVDQFLSSQRLPALQASKYLQLIVWNGNACNMLKCKALSKNGAAIFSKLSAWR